MENEKEKQGIGIDNIENPHLNIETVVPTAHINEITGKANEVQQERSNDQQSESHETAPVPKSSDSKQELEDNQEQENQKPQPAPEDVKRESIDDSTDERDSVETITPSA
ncbi:hypothetical protein [Pedobacter sandarakinus]|uniref:hypothetical protein n=1 Tax=Pedobacter sandarakinus TaxID=353156 RepID=UPI00224667BD|nr:hypothetical protein [Pedobacter sandarakinus]MCX2574674.1 hypothetical protein [Pedobacter sandarakinus]